eukprot:935488-Amphidinium_carterae.1
MSVSAMDLPVFHCLGLFLRGASHHVDAIGSGSESFLTTAGTYSKERQHAVFNDVSRAGIGQRRNHFPTPKSTPNQKETK